MLTAVGVPKEQVSVGPLEAMSQTSSGQSIFRADYVFDERLVRALLDSPGTVLLTPADSSSPGRVAAIHAPHASLAETLQLLSGEGYLNGNAPGVGLFTVTPLELVPAYTSTLRKTAAPYLLPLTSATVGEVEARLFAA
jgi:hypothetical protein